MANSQMYNSGSINFILIFNRILLTFSAFCALVLFLVPINDSVTIQSGEVLAEVPQIDYLAPFESVVDSIYVNEGTPLKTGDTLAVLINLELSNQYSIRKNTVENNRNVLTSLELRVLGLDDQLKYLINQKKIATDKNRIEQRKNRDNLRLSEEKLTVLQQKANISLEKLKIDSTLFRDKALSQLQLRNTFISYLEDKNQMLQAKDKINEFQNNEMILRNQLKESLNNLDIKINELENQYNQLIEQKNKILLDIENSKMDMDFFRSETEKQYVISEVDGQVGYIFNISKSSNFITKNQLLFSVYPDQNNFFIKATIAQKDIKYVKKDQQVTLKQDTYDYLQHGSIQGRVSYIPERKQNETFYILIDLVDQSMSNELKSGFSVTGKIITEELKLYKYLVKILFRKYDQQMDLNTPLPTPIPKQP